MRKFNIFLLFFVISFLQSFAQIDTIKIDEITVTTQRLPLLYSETSRIVSVIDKKQLENAPAQSLQDVLEYALNVDVRQRGSNGVQADVSIRGGSFNQTLILLNGVKINDPQTGHHNMDLPIDVNDIERIEILEGAGSRVFGANAFSGAINIITGNKKKKNIKVYATGGENGYLKAGSSLTYTTEKSKHFLSVSKSKADGYAENTDFDIQHIFYQNTTTTEVGEINFQAGYSEKEFGALNFYTAKYPNQFEATKTKFINFQLEQKGKINKKYNIYWRRHNDRFELFREGENWYQRQGNLFVKGNDTLPSWYTGHNYHQSDVYGAESNFYFTSKLGKTAFGLEFRSENILSNVLGEEMRNTKEVPEEEYGIFDKSKSRTNMGIFLEHHIFIGDFAISGGILANYNSDFDWNNYFGVDASYKITENFKIFANFNQSLRLPTYTELYYKSITHKNNLNLKSEKANTIESGLKITYPFLQAHISGFKRFGTDMIDWIVVDDTLSQSYNIKEVNTTGFETAVQVLPKSFDCTWLNALNFTYAYLKMEKEDGDFISLYVLDYLKHKLSIAVEHPLFLGINASWRINWKDRENGFVEFGTGKKINHKPFGTIDMKLFLKQNHFNYFIEVNNLLDEEYFDFGNIQREGRWVKLGLNIDIDL